MLKIISIPKCILGIKRRSCRKNNKEQRKYKPSIRRKGSVIREY